MRNEYDQRTCLAYAKEEGKEEGFVEIAKNMLVEGMEPALVARITKLPLKAVKALR
jgi:hypothetical protein